MISRTAARQASPFLTTSWSLLKFMSTESMMPSKHLILRCPFLLLPSVFLSIRVFSNVSAAHITWQSIGVSASASVLPRDSQESSPAPQLCSAQPSLWSNSHIHTWLLKNIYITLTVQVFVGKVMSLFLICCLGLS